MEKFTGLLATLIREFGHPYLFYLGNGCRFPFESGNQAAFKAYRVPLDCYFLPSGKNAKAASCCRQRTEGGTIPNR